MTEDRMPTAISCFSGFGHNRSGKKWKKWRALGSNTEVFLQKSLDSGVRMMDKLLTGCTGHKFPITQHSNITSNMDCAYDIVGDDDEGNLKLFFHPDDELIDDCG